MDTRINVNIPQALFQKATQLVEEGHYANFSELIRDGIRKQIAEYQKTSSRLSEDEQKLFALLRKADEDGLLLDEKEMKKHGLRV